jgi:hypothetical protein
VAGARGRCHRDREGVPPQRFAAERALLHGVLRLVSGSPRDIAPRIAEVPAWHWSRLVGMPREEPPTKPPPSRMIPPSASSSSIPAAQPGRRTHANVSDARALACHPGCRGRVRRRRRERPLPVGTRGHLAGGSAGMSALADSGQSTGSPAGGTGTLELTDQDTLKLHVTPAGGRLVNLVATYEIRGIDPMRITPRPGRPGPGPGT